MYKRGSFLGKGEFFWDCQERECFVIQILGDCFVSTFLQVFTIFGLDSHQKG